MKVFTRSWPFVWGGLLVGIAQVIYYLKFKSMIPITTGLARMYGTIEENLTHTDFVTRLYSADIHWIIIGIFTGACLVTLLERERRSWVRHPFRVVALAFLGGALFGFGTRIAQGCTTWHYLGGIPAMSLTSWAVAIVSIPFAYLAFLIMGKLNAGSFLKHQETKSTVMRCVELEYQVDTVSYDPEHRPYKDPVRLILTTLFLTLVVSSLWTALKGESPSSFGQSSIVDISIRTLVGFLLGFGIAKSGFGTECAVMAPKSLLFSPHHFERLKVAKITQTIFTGLMPFAGLLVAILLFNITLLITWIGFGWEIPQIVESGRYRWGFHLGHLVGGPLLGIGSVLMIGCEIRTYARGGMAYLTGLASLPGFLAGYLPYIFFKEKIDELFFTRGFMKEKNILQLLPENLFIQYGFATFYTTILIALLIWAIKKGSQVVRVTPKEYITKSTDEVFLKGLHAENQ